MFGELLKAAKSVTDIVDATVGLALKPVTDGADFITEGLREFTQDDRD